MKAFQLYGFVEHSFTSADATAQDKQMARFITKNVFKGIAIANTWLLLVSFCLFKTYRNSHLLKMHVSATLLGAGFGVIGVSPVFDAYLFNKYALPLSVLQEENTKESAGLKVAMPV